MSRNVKLNWLLSCGSVLPAGLLFSVTLAGDANASPASSVIGLAVFVSLACFLLLPGADDLRGSIVNSASAAALFAVLLQLPATPGLPPALLFRVCLILFCVGMLFCSVTQLLESIRPDIDNPRVPILLLTAIIGSSPVWLGPAVDIYQPDDTLIDGIVSITPLTHLSVALEYDYLRGEWLYRHSPFGSLRYVYPGFHAIVAAYILSVFVLRIILWRIARRRPALKDGDPPGKNYT